MLVESRMVGRKKHTTLRQSTVRVPEILGLARRRGGYGSAALVLVQVEWGWGHRLQVLLTTYPPFFSSPPEYLFYYSSAELSAVLFSISANIWAPKCKFQFSWRKLLVTWIFKSENEDLCLRRLFGLRVPTLNCRLPFIAHPQLIDMIWLHLSFLQSSFQHKTINA